MANEPQTTVLRCATCNLPFARIQHGALVIQSRHHGEAHTNAISLAELKTLLEAEGLTIVPTDVSVSSMWTADAAEPTSVLTTS